jgi:hypothetical protein
MGLGLNVKDLIDKYTFTYILKGMGQRSFPHKISSQFFFVHIDIEADTICIHKINQNWFENICWLQLSPHL